MTSTLAQHYPLPQKVEKAPIGRCVSYSHSRVGLSRRSLSIPHPLHFGALCHVIQSEWDLLKPLVSDHRLAASRPVAAKVGRAVLPARAPHQMKHLRTAHRARGRYLARTDIAQFYPTIYTHSLAWAAHGKADAKLHRKYHQRAGNRLDTHVRGSQDGQTIGVPIGPDTSLILAELIMQRVDHELIDRHPFVDGNGFRYVDDYEISCSSYAEAEAVLHTIAEVLAEYELRLSPTKSAILELPLGVEDSWSVDLRRFVPRAKTRIAQTDEAITYFGRAFELARAWPDGTVLQYAISSLRGVVLTQTAWTFTLGLLCQCMLTEPGTIPRAVELYIAHHAAGLKSDADMVAGVLNSVIERHAPLRHSSEVSWAIWGLIVLSHEVTADAAAKLADMVDPVAALLALDAHARGLNPHMDATAWASLMTPEDLWSGKWMLAYEASVKGWLPSAGGGDHIAGDPFFAKLRAAGVTFYDVAGGGLHVPAAVAPFAAGLAGLSGP